MGGLELAHPLFTGHLLKVMSIDSTALPPYNYRSRQHRVFTNWKWVAAKSPEVKG